MSDANDFRIDEARLDVEWIRQAQLMRRYGEEQADANFARDRAKSALELTAARLRLRIRRAPADFGLDKPTVNDVDAAIVVQEEYQQANLTHLTKAHAADVAKAAVTAMVDKRKALENRVEMLRLGFLAERDPRASFEQAGKLNDSARREIRGGVDEGERE